MADLGRLRFHKNMHEVDGRKVQHVASAEETRLAITKLLQRRQDFLLQRNIAADNYVMTNEQRRDIFRIWKDEYHGTPFQQELQRCDSWKRRAMANANVVLLSVPVKVKVVLLSLP